MTLIGELVILLNEDLWGHSMLCPHENHSVNVCFDQC